MRLLETPIMYYANHDFSFLCELILTITTLIPPTCGFWQTPIHQSTDLLIRNKSSTLKLAAAFYKFPKTVRAVRLITFLKKSGDQAFKKLLK